MSTKTRLVIEQEVKELLERALLTTHKKELHALYNALIEHETLSGKSDKGSSCTGKLSAATRYSSQTEHYPQFSTPNPAAAAAAATAASAKTKVIAPVGS